MAVLGQNWKENNYLRHQNISAPLDGMYGSKAVNKTLLGVSSKIGEAKIKKELEFFQRHGFWLWPRTWRASYEVGGTYKMNIEIALKPRSYILDLDCIKMSLGIFLFLELFNGKFFFTSFQDIPLVFSKAHTKKPKTLRWA